MSYIFLHVGWPENSGKWLRYRILYLSFSGVTIGQGTTNAGVDDLYVHVAEIAQNYAQVFEILYIGELLTPFHLRNAKLFKIVYMFAGSEEKTPTALISPNLSDRKSCGSVP